METPHRLKLSDAMSLPRNVQWSSSRERRNISYGILAFVMTVMMYYITVSDIMAAPTRSTLSTQASPQSPLLHSLFNSYRHPLTAKQFQIPTGETFTRGDDPRFTEPLGKNVLILDVDSRPLDEPETILSGHLPDLDAIPSDSMVRLSHYIYGQYQQPPHSIPDVIAPIFLTPLARIHGYDYKLGHPSSQGYPDTWSKVPAVLDELKKYKYVVFMDADTVLPYPHLLLEWMMDLWGIKKETLIAMTRGVDAPANYDSHGQIGLNTGFMIAQQSPRTMEMFEAWKDCVHDLRYPGCSNYTGPVPHEQYAFGNWVRYDFDGSDEVVTIPCSNATAEECHGGLLVQYSSNKGKGMAKAAVQRSIMQYFMGGIQQELHREYSQTVDKDS